MSAKAAKHAPEDCYAGPANSLGFPGPNVGMEAHLRNSLQTDAADYSAERLFAELHDRGFAAYRDRGFDKYGAALLRNEDAD